MSEIIRVINVYDELIQKHSKYSYEIEIDLIQEVTRYDNQTNTRYYTELLRLKIKKITKRKWWQGGDKRESVLLTKWDFNEKESGQKQKIIKYAREQVDNMLKDSYYD